MGVGGTPRSRNLILGIAEDMEWAGLRPFVESLERTSFDGEVRLFVSGMSLTTRRRLRRLGVRLHSYRRARFEFRGTVFDAYTPPLRRFRSWRIAASYPLAVRRLSRLAPDRRRARAWLAAPLRAANVARHLRYYRYLASAGERYDNVMLSDTRDVFFTHDPFDFEIGDALHCFLEESEYTLGTEPINRRWLTETYGEEVAVALGDRPVSCAGVTIGSYGAVLAYLSAMVDELSQLRARNDQPVHNYVVHNGLAPRVRLVRNGEGPVLTLGLMEAAAVSSLLPDRYAEFSVLHQYDRHPRLAEALLAELEQPDARVAATGSSGA